MKKFKRKTIILILIACILFIIPFFWLSLGEMDLGGDSHRLYFYDPVANIKAFSFYSVVPWGTGIVLYNQYFLPYTLVLVVLKFFVHSPTLLIALFNGFKLSLSFIFIFLILKELFRKNRIEDLSLSEWSASLIGAFVYTFSSAILDNIKYALITHDLVFINPLLVFLVLRYLVTTNIRYLWVALLTTFVFSSSFSLFNPPLFAFYPLVIIFLLLYNFYVLEKPFPWKGIIFILLFFTGLHAFHLIPVTTNLLDKGSELNTRAFEGFSKTNTGLEYFNAIAQFSKVSPNILMPLELSRLRFSLFIIPFLVSLGFLCIKRKNKTVFLISVFFLITLFLKSANITHIGLEFYRKLFLLPGFGMFRNFVGQWQFVYTFFYSLFVGFLLSFVFVKIKSKYLLLILFITVGFLLARSWMVFNGNIVHVTQRGSENVTSVIRIDPHYEAMLSYLKKIPNDGKILHVPFTDFAYNLVGGTNNGVYVGQSMVSLLAGRNDFAGYQHIDPFSENFVKLAKEKNYLSIKEMLSLLQVRYILYNSDKKISDAYFPEFPYGYNGVPASSSAALDFVKHLAKKKVYTTGHYSLFEVDKKFYLPHFYAASHIVVYDKNQKFQKQYSGALSFFPPQTSVENKDIRNAFIDRITCNTILSKKSCNTQVIEQDVEKIQIVYQRINPTKYKLEIRNASHPFLLVFQNAYNSDWSLYAAHNSLATKDISDKYFEGKIIELKPATNILDKNPFETNSLQSVSDNRHISVNEYANAWYITPKNTQEKYEIIVEMTGQKKFYYSLLISLVTLSIFIIYGVMLFRNNK